MTDDGTISYKEIKGYIQRYGAAVRYNATYLAKEKKLVGYHVWKVSYDDNWELSLAAQEESNKQQPEWRLLVIILTTTPVILVLGLVITIARRKNAQIERNVDRTKESESKLIVNHLVVAGDFNSDDPNLQVYSLAEIEAATNKLSIENKLGQGGYGPVYKGILPNGQEIAVKKLSQASTQGFEVSSKSGFGILHSKG
ncbi:hypothetical protein CJ030_MR5G010025 [Morella rubra]|uniref:Uncharacterized protein n=1 Tax=Morella rubra TaxID=262757 RepID=A0A6A1VJ45_9ROSI|nr:hypothetical protein CJ030_MR5G010025 [Morella rubra]